MRLNQTHIEQLKSKFEIMKSKEDLLALLNMANQFIYQEKVLPLRLKTLTYYSHPSVATKRYRQFNLRKKSGGIRTISSPVAGLKSLQRALNLVLQCVFEPHKSATGFIQGKSIVDNAKVHVNQNYVFNIDLKEFFPGIDQARIWKQLQFPPFNLNEQTNRLELANRIAALCCAEMEVSRQNENGEWVKQSRFVLPQGAPTSPIVSNIIAYRLDKKLSGLAKRFNLNYTRYADDISFSSHHNVYQDNSTFTIELNRIIASQSFYVNPDKTRLQKNGFRKEVTGLVVNQKVNVSRRYVKQIRMWIYYWERYGFERASSIFRRDYYRDKGHIKKGMPDMANVLEGKLLYLKMVRGGEDITFLGLYHRFQQLISKDESMIKVLDEWQNNGIEKAMDLFYHEKSNK